MQKYYNQIKMLSQKMLPQIHLRYIQVPWDSFTVSEAVSAKTDDKTMKDVTPKK